MMLKEYKKEDGEIIQLPEGFHLAIEETSNGVYRINLSDIEGRSAGNHGTDLDGMIEHAIADLRQMRKV